MLSSAAHQQQRLDDKTGNKDDKKRLNQLQRTGRSVMSWKPFCENRLEVGSVVLRSQSQSPSNCNHISGTAPATGSIFTSKSKPQVGTAPAAELPTTGEASSVCFGTSSLRSILGSSTISNNSRKFDPPKAISKAILNVCESMVKMDEFLHRTPSHGNVPLLATDDDDNLEQELRMLRESEESLRHDMEFLEHLNLSTETTSFISPKLDSNHSDCFSKEDSFTILTVKKNKDFSATPTRINSGVVRSDKKVSDLTSPPSVADFDDAASSRWEFCNSDLLFANNKDDAGYKKVAEPDTECNNENIYLTRPIISLDQMNGGLVKPRQYHLSLENSNHQILAQVPSIGQELLNSMYHNEQAPQNNIPGRQSKIQNHHHKTMPSRLLDEQTYLRHNDRTHFYPSTNDYKAMNISHHKEALRDNETLHRYQREISQGQSLGVADSCRHRRSVTHEGDRMQNVQFPYFRDINNHCNLWPSIARMQCGHDSQDISLEAFNNSLTSNCIRPVSPGSGIATEQRSSIDLFNLSGSTDAETQAPHASSTLPLFSQGRYLKRQPRKPRAVRHSFSPFPRIRKYSESYSPTIVMSRPHDFDDVEDDFSAIERQQPREKRHVHARRIRRLMRPENIIDVLARIAFGYHEYTTTSSLSLSRKDNNLYIRTHQGGLCVYIAITALVASFYGHMSDIQFWSTLVIAPPALTYFEVNVPHRVDEIFIALSVMALRWALVRFVVSEM